MGRLRHPKELDAWKYAARHASTIEHREQLVHAFMAGVICERSGETSRKDRKRIRQGRPTPKDRVMYNVREEEE